MIRVHRDVSVLSFLRRARNTKGPSVPVHTEIDVEIDLVFHVSTGRREHEVHVILHVHDVLETDLVHENDVNAGLRDHTVLRSLLSRRIEHCEIFHLDIVYVVQLFHRKDSDIDHLEHQLIVEHHVFEGRRDIDVVEQFHRFVVYDDLVEVAIA